MPTPSVCQRCHRCKWRRPRQLNKLGFTVAVLHLAAAVAYFYYRIRYTLVGAALEHPDYARYVLIVELFSAVSMLLYSSNLLFVTKIEKLGELAKEHLEQHQFRYRVHFLVATYKEPFTDVVQPTLEAALKALKPDYCRSVEVHLCDDQPPSADPDSNHVVKKQWCADNAVTRHSRPETESALGTPQVVYVSTRNPKSCNVNHALTKINERQRLGDSDVIIILDCDQHVQPHFLRSTLHFMAAHDDIGMVITPQRFSNVVEGADVLNHINADYWDLILPGLDGLGFISCPGTNFLIRGSALTAIRDTFNPGTSLWVPESTVTEDYALGMDLKAIGMHAVYVNDHTCGRLCEGEAPHAVVDSFQQRCRWAMGHFQIFLSGDNPLIKSGLRWYMKLMYCSSVYTYLVSIMASLTLSAIPLINLWLGWFPLHITTSFIISFTLYFLAGILLKYGPAMGGDVTVRGIWFASCANILFCLTYLWAFLFALPGKVHFKVTPHGRDAETIWGRMKGGFKTFFSDLWLNCFFFAFSIISLYCVSIKMEETASVKTGNPLKTPVVLCMAWVAYNALPHLLLIIWFLLHVPAYAGKDLQLESQRAAREGTAAKPNGCCGCWDMFMLHVLRVLFLFVQLISSIVLISIFVLAFLIAFLPGNMQEYCGLFPFYFTSNVGINRARWSHHPECQKVVVWG